MDILGWGEWLLIGILALVIIGPRDLPKVFQKISLVIQQLRQASAGFRQEWEGLLHKARVEDVLTPPAPQSPDAPKPAASPKSQPPRKWAERRSGPSKRRAKAGPADPA